MGIPQNRHRNRNRNVNQSSGQTVCCLHLCTCCAVPRGIATLSRASTPSPFLSLPASFLYLPTNCNRICSIFICNLYPICRETPPPAPPPPPATPLPATPSPSPAPPPPCSSSIFEPAHLRYAQLNSIIPPSLPFPLPLLLQ